MNHISEEELIDYLNGELPEGRQREVAAALITDPALAEELQELEFLFSEVIGNTEPEPSAAADARFTELLQTSSLTETPATATRQQATVRSLLWKVAGIAAAIALVFTAGRFYEGGATSDSGRELTATRTLMLELMKDDRTSARIRATTVTFDLETLDEETVKDLGYLLRNDGNANVRLAALDALRRFASEPAVTEELLAAMAESPPDVLRFELIETLVRAKEQRVLPYLQELIETDTLPRQVRDVAQMAAFKLI